MAPFDVYWDHHIPLPKLPPLKAKITVATVALLCFINSYDGDFVFDDSEAIINNKVVCHWSLSSKLIGQYAISTVFFCFTF